MLCKVVLVSTCAFYAWAKTPEDTDKKLLQKRLEAKAVGLWEFIRDIAAEKDGSINKNRLGRWLKRNEGRVVLRFVRDESSRGSVKWKAQVL